MNYKDLITQIENNYNIGYNTNELLTTLKCRSFGIKNDPSL